MSFTVGEKDEGRALAVFLAKRFTYHSESEWAERIGSGRVTVCGKRVNGEAPLKAGDLIRYDVSGVPEPPVDERVSVVLEDALLLAVNKPGNLPCHPGGRYFNHTLWALVKERMGVSDPVLINRLDRETSGLVLIGKTPEAAHNLWKQFSSRLVVKRYTVYVEGALEGRLQASGWLVPDGQSVIRKKRRFVPAASAGGTPPCPDAEWAETVVEGVSRSGDFSVVSAEPKTGRLHQIRATLCSLGFPVVGDKVYGVDETSFIRFCTDSLSAEDWGRLRLRRQALHAGYLRFRHPRFGAWTELRVDVPEDMADLVLHKEPPVRGL
jgi:RluA family pseudouridine synthase